MSSSSLESNSTDTSEAANGSSSIIKKEKPKIMPLPNGPYYLLNDMKPKIVGNLQNSKGEPLSTVTGVALCRCGASNNKPFCDGTHATIGFSSENKGTVKDGSSEEKKVIKHKRKDYVGKKIIVHDNRRICSHAAECVNNLTICFST
jgi:CDGSH-type Zn-finger protein